MKKYFWFKNCKSRVAKSFFPQYHDGCIYSFENYNILMSICKNIKLGGTVYNPYLHKWTIIKKIEMKFSPMKYDWSSRTKSNYKKSTRSIGKMIQGDFYFVDENDCFIYDPLDVYAYARDKDWYIEKFNKESWEEFSEGLKKFNLSVGLPEEQFNFPTKR